MHCHTHVLNVSHRSETTDQHCSRPAEEGWQAVRSGMLQKQSFRLESWHVSQLIITTPASQRVDVCNVRGLCSCRSHCGSRQQQHPSCSIVQLK